MMAMEKLKIAICGGGIASLCLAHGLSKNPNLEVKIFEKSTTLRQEETGAAVGLGPNAQKAMSLISPELRAAIDDAGGVPMHPHVRFMACTGPHANQHIVDVETRDGGSQIICYWGSLYRALYKTLSEGVLQLGKATVNVSDSPVTGCVRLDFEGGTSYDAHAVVGCDGINSVVRREVLGADNPGTQAVYADRINHRVVVPIEEARAVFGDDYCNVHTQYGHIGHDCLLITDHSNHGTAMQVIADFGMTEPWTHDRPFVEWPKEKMHEFLGRCGDIGKSMIKIYDAQPTLYAGRLRYHKETSTFYKGQICLAGDAAFAFLPFLGAGAGQACEDAMILSTVLNVCTNIEDIRRAFAVYDAIRRPRRTNVAHASSHEASLTSTGRDPEAGMDIEKLAKKLKTYGLHLYDYDLAASQQEALDKMAEGDPAAA